MAKTVKKEKKKEPLIPKTFRISPEHVKTLNKEEKSQGVSQSSLIREAIDLKFPPKIKK